MNDFSIWMHSHALLLILTFAALFTIEWLLAVRKRLNMPWYAAVLLGALHVVYGVFCVRVFARMEGAGSGSMSLFGAVFFMPVAYYLGAKLFKRPMAEVFDLFAVPMIFTLLCARCNCLIAGCCLGTFIPGMELRWPTREVEVIFYAAFLIVFIPRVLKKKTHGEVYPFYMLSYGVLRFILEFLRVTDRTESLFHLSHVWALISAGIGLAFVLYLRKKNSVSPKTARHK